MDDNELRPLLDTIQTVTQRLLTKYDSLNSRFGKLQSKLHDTVVRVHSLENSIQQLEKEN